MPASKYHDWGSLGAEPVSGASSNGRSGLTGVELFEYALTEFGSKHPRPQDWQCPAHDDVHASLGVKKGDNGGVVINCQAGCEPKAIVAALGLRMKDLFPAKGTISAVYDYVDESGKLLFQVVREEPKKFWQRAPDGTKSIKDIRRVLYRLPQVIAAAKANQIVYVVEGERDVEALEALDKVATCNPGGGGPGKWRDEYSQSLVGAKVVIVLDRDVTGYKHGLEVLNSLRDLSIKCRVMAPVVTDEHADVRDHLAAGYGISDLLSVSDGDLEQLISGDEDDGWTPDIDADDIKLQATRLLIVEAARDLVEAFHSVDDPFPEWLDNLTEARARPKRQQLWRAEYMWPDDSNLLIAAGFKTGKTTLAMNLQRSLTDGEPFLGEFKVRPVEGTVGYLNYELSEDMWNDWERDINLVNTDHAWALHLRGYNVALGSDWFAEEVAKRSTEILIVDNFGAAFTGNENDNSEVRNWLRTLEIMASKAGVLQLILIAHTGRIKPEEGEEHARGATRLDDWADVRWIYTVEQGQRFLSASGRDVAVEEFNVDYESMTRTLTYGSGASRSEARLDSLIDQAVSIVLTAGAEGIAPSKVAASMGRSRGRASMDQVLARAVSSGAAIESMTSGRGTKWRPIVYAGMPWEVQS